MACVMIVFDTTNFSPPSFYLISASDRIATYEINRYYLEIKTSEFIRPDISLYCGTCRPS